MLYAEVSENFWGKEYYARKADVRVFSQDDYNSAVRIYLTDDTTKIPVIINTDKPVAEGERVRIVSGSDLIEIR